MDYPFFLLNIKNINSFWKTVPKTSTRIWVAFKEGLEFQILAQNV